MDIIKDSLDLIGNTPLLLVKNLDTGPCNLYLKLESFNLGGSIKDRPAKNMIIEAKIPLINIACGRSRLSADNFIKASFVTYAAMLVEIKMAPFILSENFIV